MALSKVKAIKEFFGLRDGDKPSDFMKELKALNDDDRLELAQSFQ